MIDRIADDAARGEISVDVVRRAPAGVEHAFAALRAGGVGKIDLRVR